MAPFRGVRYAADRVTDLAEVTSPPYDVIPHDIEDKLIAADPHNVVRLILPRHASGRADDVYQDAARTLHGWLDERILVPDPVPGLYVYEQAADAAVLQRGLIGALRLVPPEAGIVLPHEDVVPGPVTGRRQLMEATQANLEPIFLLYDGSRPGAATRLVEDVAASREPLAEALTEDAVRHRLWAVTDPAEIAAVAADLAPRQALIADGHHRYAAYRQLQARRRDAGPPQPRGRDAAAAAARPGRRPAAGRAVGLRTGAARRLRRLSAQDRRDPPGDPAAGPGHRGRAREGRVLRPAAA